MIQYVVAGLVIGGVYSIVSLGLITTYMSTGIFNFGFAGLAYFIARFYYFLHVQHGWGIASSGIISIVIAGPVLGVVLWAVVFRQLANRSPVVRIVATIGIGVAAAPLASLAFGNLTTYSQVGLAPEPVGRLQVLGVVLNANQLMVLGCVVVVLVAGFVVARFTPAGLKMRAVVDSETMSALSGVNPKVVAMAVWAFSTFLAGLAGVLIAPIVTLDPTTYTLLVADAVAAVVVAQLRRPGIAVVASLALGIVGSILTGELPASSSGTGMLVDSLPFLVVLGVLLTPGIRRSSQWGGDSGTRDRGHVETGTFGAHDRIRRRPGRDYLPPILLLAVGAILPMVLSDFWLGTVAFGVAYGIAFLSYTLTIGQGGFVSLCQISLAGVGAVTAAQLATNHGWPVLLAVLAGGVVTAPAGAVIGWLTLRLDDLYTALVTLMFGLLLDTTLFTWNYVSNNQAGVMMNRPSWIGGNVPFFYLCLVAFVIVGLVLVRYRITTSGMALSAVRWSRAGAQSLGINAVAVRLEALSLGAFIAGCGGGFLALAQGNANPANFGTLVGMVWLAVLVLNGVSSIVAALIAGIAFTVIPALFQNYLPLSLQASSLIQIPAALFGLGAVAVVKNPDGIVSLHGHQLAAVGRYLKLRVAGREPPRPVAQAGDPEQVKLLEDQP